ncbi:MAG: AAA family ATPase [Thermomicrobiales bacterium]|nr:AAA family ATPase [Thermomicrobiales bacterium]
MIRSSIDVEQTQPRPPLRSVPHRSQTPARQLPRSLSSFVGRSTELRVVCDLLERPDIRLVTLTGPGGIGKTRLAIEAAEAASDEFADGVVLVPLGSTERPADFARTVATALGLVEVAGQTPDESVAAFLRDRSMLLVLDNFEHILAAAALVAEWLVSCRWLCVLTTSRAGLNLSGEQIVAVHPLDVPDPAQTTEAEGLEQVASVRLFVDRARSKQHDFSLTSGNAPAIAAICRQLDGLPLAIELAAAHMQHLTPEALLDRLEHRMPVLTNGHADLPPRLRSMEDAIGWSYDLLSDREQGLFRRLSLLAGGFTLDAAEAIDTDTAHTYDNLTSLVNQSLIQPLLASGREGRYRMLEPVREFGMARFTAQGELNATRSALADYYVELAERLDATIWGGPHHRSSLDLLEAELPNLRSALDWLESVQDGARLLRLSAALGGLWFFRSHRLEGRDWLAKSLAMPDASDPEARATGLVKLTLLDLDLGAAPSPAWGEEAVRLRLPLGNDVAIASAYSCQGFALLAGGEFDPALGAFANAKVHALRSGNPASLARVSFREGLDAISAGDHELAISSFGKARALFAENGFSYGVLQALNMLGDLESARGNGGAACRHYQESLSLYPDTLSQERFLDTLAGAGTLAARLECWTESARLLGAADALRTAIGQVPSAARRASIESAIRSATDHLGPDAFRDAWQSGHRLTLDQARLACVEVLVSLGRDARRSTLNADAAPGGLTRREVDVVELLASGKSNREIADALMISQSTAISHVRNILAKLDLDSRAAVAAWAVRNGLG